MVRVFIALGSNLDNPRRQVERAIETIKSLPETRFTAVSRLYRSDPVGPPGQPDYVNAVLAADTGLMPLQLLDELQAIEQAHDRQRGQHWGPRTLDLDILLFGDRVINDQRLNIPHPHLAERPFVLYPLAELAPALILPDSRSLPQLLAACPSDGLDVLDSCA